MSNLQEQDTTQPRLNGVASKPKNVELLARIDALLLRAEQLDQRIKNMESVTGDARNILGH